MQKILIYLEPLLRLNYRHPALVLFIAVLLAVTGGYFAVQLKIDTDLANLLPRSNEHVQAMDQLQETVGGETEMEVVIRSPSFEDNRRFAEDLMDRSLELYDPRTDDQFFKRAEFRKDTEVLKDNALYLATDRELNDITAYLQEEIRDARDEANPFLVDFEDEDEEEGEVGEDPELDRFQDSYDALIPPEYPVNEDSTVAVVKFYPTGSKSDITYLEDMFAAYGELINEMDPASYNEEMEVYYGGRLQRHLAELNSIMNDVFNSFASGISSVILLVLFYFFFKKYINYRRGSDEQQHHHFLEHIIRVPVPAMVIGIPLLISLCWTFGITYAVLGMLNTMTSVLFVILFGMGIDYGIHFYARYIEKRSAGEGVEEALFNTYESTGSAIVVSALTTAFSLFILVIAQFRGFSEFGFIAGTGIILALFCMLFVLPSLLVIFERWNWILFNENDDRKTTGHKPHRFPFARTIVIAGMVVAAFVAWNYDGLRFEYNFGDLEPEFPEYRAFRELSSQVSSSDKRNPAYIVADDEQDVLDIIAELRDRMENDTLSSTILDVEALQERFPYNDSVATDKLEKIAHIRELLDDSFIRGQEDEQLDRLRRASQTREPMDVEDIPDYLKSQFVTQDGEIGNFVIVYPSVGLSDGRNSIAFKEDVGEIELDEDRTFYAASTSIIAAEMLELMRKESPYMVGATFVIIFLLMLFSFRSFRWTVIAMLPLVVGLVFMFAIMIVTGMRFNFYNLVVLPAILGIGEDSGVHLAHRYREEGKNSMWDVLSSTGQHITIGSITTMLGFSGLLFTAHPGLQSLGQMAVLGIGMTLLTSLTFLPALIQWLEDKEWIRF